MSLFGFGKKAQLLVTATVAGIDERWTFKLKENRVVIGRKEGYNPKDNQLFVIKEREKISIASVPITKMTISREHCELVWDARGRTYSVQRLSKGEVLVNSHPLERKEKAILDDQFTISIGEGALINLQILY
ncbi:FHA domain-containing protein [Candidatus Woesearchaeota archaeon]|nr:FHA domain-containing protein [Candidatus Woesearchaeota archaeon]